MKPYHIQQKDIVFTGGGTGGHVFPGLALLQSLLDSGEHKRLNAFAWIGSEHGAERQFVEKRGLDFFGVKVGKLRRYISIKNVFDPFNILIGIIQARKILKKMNPKVLISIGGFVSVSSVLAAATLRIPILSVSCDMTLGLATKIGLPFSTMLFCSYKETAQQCCQSKLGLFFFQFQKKKRKRFFSHIAPSKLSALQLRYDTIESWCVGLGNPIRQEVYSGDATRINTQYEIGEGQTVVLFLGGSKGATQINEMVPRLLSSFDKHMCIIHQTGVLSNAIQTPNEKKVKNNNDYACKYIVIDFMSEEYADMLARADVVIARAGAGTLWEIVANGIPAGIIPLSKEHSRGDQIENAAYFSKKNMVIDLGTHPSDMEVKDAIQTLSEDTVFIASIQSTCKIFDAQSGAKQMGEYISGFL